MDMSDDFMPRKWQLRALASWSVEMRGIAKVVTGGGKTSFALMCMKQYFRIFPNGKCIILVPSIALLDQWYVDIISDTNITKEDISVYGGGSKPETYSKINLMTLNTGRNMVGKIFSKDDFLIVDECHKAASEENSRCIDHDIRYYSLGLSATPERQYDDGFKDILIPKLGSLIIEYDYIQARKEGVICDFKLFNVRVEMSEEELEEYIGLSKRIGKAINNKNNEFENAEKLAMKRARKAANAKMRIPTTNSILESVGSRKTIVFHESIESAEEICNLLNQKGNYALTYHSKMTDAIRRDNLLRFKNGTCNVLITCRALDEGANIPEANLGIIAASTKSDRQRIQRLGRVLRKAPGKNHALIYTIYCTDSEEENLLKEANQLDGLTEVKWLEAKP